MKIKLIIFLLISFSILAGKYKTIENEAVRVIYEEGLYEEVNEAANYIHTLRTYYINNGFQGDLKKIPLVLKKGNNISNAYFSPMPNKMEFISIGPIGSDLGVSPWLLDLSIHEYRHFMQYQLIKENKYAKLAYILGGEGAVNIIGGGSIPMWVWEGDAVYFETKLSHNGRGRTADFLKEYRMLFNNDTTYSYEKAKNESYKDLVPSHYHLGYLLVNYGYEKFGENFWEEAFEKGIFGESLTPFSKYIKSKTGLSSTEFYEEAMAYYKKYFNEKDKEEYRSITNEPNTITNQYFAYPYNDRLISLMGDYDNAKAFYMIKNNEKTKITDLGLLYDNYFEVNGNNIIWSEIEPSFKDKNINFYNIKLYDLKNNKKFTITKNNYYQSPSLSNKTDKIAAIKHNGFENPNIDILDKSGKVIKSLKNINNYFYNYIKWDKEDKNLIAAARDSKGQMGIIEINLDTQEEKIVLDFDHYIIGVPFIDENNIYFNASFSYIENIYKLNRENNKLYQITDSYTSAKFPVLASSRLYFSELDTKGLVLKETNDILGKEFVIKKNLKEDEKLNIPSIKNTDFVLNEINFQENFQEKKYNYLSNLINVHTWSYSLFPGLTNISLFSTNELEDLRLMLNYTDDNLNNKKEISIMTDYTRYWPNFRLNIFKDLELDHNKGIVDIVFPFYLSKNEYKREGLGSIGYVFDKEDLMKFDFSFLNSKYKGYKDIKSPFSQNIQVSYLEDINNSSRKRLFLDTVFTNKAFGENDSLTYNFSYDNNKNSIDFPKENLMSREYKEKSYDYAIKNTIEYDFPIAYPDFGKYGYYLQRIRGNIFYDNTLLNNDKNYESYGLASDFDNKIFALIPVTLRLQYTYLKQEKTSKFGLGFKLEM